MNERDVRFELEQRLDRVDWFGCCGTDEPLPQLPFACRAADSWAHAERLCADIAWENFQLDAQAALTVYLTQRHPTAMQGRWNAQIESVRQWLGEAVTPALRARAESLGLSDTVCVSAEWDLIMAVMEHIYAEYKMPAHYDAMLRVYEAGRFPCGWNTEGANGELVYY